MGESALTSFLLFTMKEVDKDDSFILHMTINHTIILLFVLEWFYSLIINVHVVMCYVFGKYLPLLQQRHC